MSEFDQPAPQPVPIEERIGPSGYPGEYQWVVQLPDGNLLSYFSGMQTVDADSIDWNLLPAIYENIAKPVGDKVWIPRMVNDPEYGLVFPDLDPTTKTDWMWVAMKAVQIGEGKKTLDTEGARQFKKYEYLDALEFVGYITSDIEPVTDGSDEK
jgi:hypothetical protein